MNQSQSSNLLDGISMITQKERQFIKSTLIKTDKTLDELRKNTMEQERKSKHSRKSQPKKDSFQKIELTSIDKHYTFLLKCIEIKLNSSHNIFLQPYTQEYFKFDMGIHVFPLILQITKISSEGILYLGFNEEFPGMQITATSKDPLSQKKILLDKVQNIEIKQPGSRNIHNIYFLFTSSKKSLSFNFKLRSSVNGSSIELIPKIRKNFFDDIDEKLKTPVKKFRVKTQLSPKFSMTKASYLQKIERISSDQNFTTFTSKFSVLNDSKLKNEDIAELKKLTKTILFNQMNSMKSYSQNDSSFSRTLSKTQYKNESITSFLRTHVNFSNSEKQEISQKNLQELQNYKEKTSRLYELVENFKEEIKMMKKDYDQNMLKQKKTLKSITIMLKLYKFVQKSQIAFIKRKNKLYNFFKTVLNVNKFIHKLKNRREASRNLVPSNIARIVYGLLPFTQLLSATIWEKSNDTAENTFSKTLTSLFPSFLMRQVLQRSENYLENIKKIQVMFRERLKAQRRMLKIYSIKNIQKLIEKFPHFKLFVNNFNDQNIHEKLISIYIKDENLKFNRRVMNYKKQLKERDEFIDVKFKMITQKRKQSPKKLKRTSPEKYDNKTDRNEFQIPPLPQKPCKSLFLNLNILETMIRNWFQLEHFMWKKKEKAKKQWL